MEKRVILVLLLIFTNIVSYSINKYEIIKIKTIKNGDGIGELLYIEGDMGLGGYPRAITIAENNKVYVCDGGNNRINIYDINFNYSEQIKIKDDEEYDISDSYKILVDEYENIIRTYSDILKTDKKGNILFQLNPSEINSDYNSYFVYEDYLIYYDKKYIYHFINNDGNILDKEKENKILDAMKTKYKGTLRDDPGLQDKLDEYIYDNNLILMGDRLLSKSKSKYKKYFNFIRENIKDRVIKDKITVNLNIILLYNLLGFDKYDNSYWMGAKSSTEADEFIIVVFSKYGEVLDCFYIDYDFGYPDVSPDGDLYNYSCSENGHTVYKIKNVWYPGNDKEN